MDNNQTSCFDRLYLLRASKALAAENPSVPVSSIVIPHKRPSRFAKGKVLVPSIPKPAAPYMPVKVKASAPRRVPAPLSIQPPTEFETE